MSVNFQFSVTSTDFLSQLVFFHSLTFRSVNILFCNSFQDISPRVVKNQISTFGTWDGFQPRVGIDVLPSRTFRDRCAHVTHDIQIAKFRFPNQLFLLYRCRAFDDKISSVESDQHEIMRIQTLFRSDWQLGLSILFKLQINFHFTPICT